MGNVILQVASALNHISSLQYVHRNVRARNVLLNRDSSCVLSGFGYVARLNKNGKYFKRDGKSAAGMGKVI